MINPNDSRIWDEAEVYVLFKEDAPNGITPFIPASVEDELDLKWLFTGLLDASAGIPFTPSLEITHFDGFGHPRYRSKAKKGSLDTGFTALEDNSVTRRLVLPGSAPNKIGKPKAVYAYVAYVLRDEDIITQCLISLEPALISVGAFTKGEGAQEMYAFTCAHPNDPNGDVFVRIESGAGPSEWLVTVPAGTTAGSFTLKVGNESVTGISYNAATAAVKSALESLSTVGTGKATVTGSAGGPFTVKLTDGGVLSSPAASLTPAGAVTVAAA
ncbi:hypothetical protein A6F56_04395 [Prescottella equi]|nr:hypothetical protein A6F56_04395 [Prescottella equi]